MDAVTEVTPHQLAAVLVAESIRAHLRVHATEGHIDPYRLGQRDAYAVAVGPSVGWGIEAAGAIELEIEDALTRGIRLDEIVAAAADVVTRTAGHTPPAAVRLEWMGPLAFRRRHPGPPGADSDFGADWGELQDQRVSLRRDIGAASGLLYAYDATWHEYAVLGVDVPLRAVEEAFGQLGRRSRGKAIEELARRVATLQALTTHPAALRATAVVEVEL